MNTQFTIAMRNNFSRGPFDRPGVKAAFALEWLIVERNGDFIAISDAGGLTKEQTKNIDGPAPDDLQRNNTLLGVFIEYMKTGEEVFMFSQFPIVTPLTIGTFFPGEGYARLCTDSNDIKLDAHGRHFHLGNPPANGGKPSDPALGLNWHFDAQQRPWAQQSL